MRNVLLTIHILAAAGFVGGGIYSLVVFFPNVRDWGFKAALARDEAIGTKFFGSAVGLLLLSGIVLVLDSDVYGWGDAFVWIGIGVIVVDGILEGAYFSPRGKRLANEEASTAAVRGFLWQSAAIHIALVVVAVYAMVAKL